MPALTLANRTVLTRHREKLGLTCAAVAEQCGVARQMISQVESGAKNPSTELLHRMAAVLGLQADVTEIVRVRLKRKP